MPNIEFIDFKDKKILYLDFSGCSFEELTAMVGKSVGLIDKQPEHSLLVLINIKNAPAERGTGSLVQSYADHNKRFIKAAAIIGLDENTRPIFEKAKTYSEQAITVFETATEAKEWLIQQY